MVEGGVLTSVTRYESSLTLKQQPCSRRGVSCVSPQRHFVFIGLCSVLYSVLATAEKVVS